jgi:hypothetical protein
MTETRRTKRLIWLVVPAALGAGTLYGVLASRGHFPAGARADSAEAASVPQKGSLLAKAKELGKERGLDATERMTESYGAWANDPGALSARKHILRALFSEPDIGKKLHGVLAAVEADPTPPEKDPLWEELASSLADLWKGDVATKAMDLVMAETRPRARHALISSFAEVATSDRLSGLSREQRQTLTETMIDVSPNVPPEQKAEVGRALRALGGNDLADIVAGKGITGKDGHVLESERAYNDSLEQTKKDLAEQGASDAP